MCKVLCKNLHPMPVTVTIAGLVCAGKRGSALSLPSCQTVVTLALAESGSNSETAH